MKKLTILFVLVTNISYAQKADLSGSVPVSLANKIITLTLMNYDTRVDKKVQEIQVQKSGAFSTVIELKEPSIYNVSLGDSSVLHMLVKPGDAIKLQIGKTKISCSGSVDTQYLIDYEANRKKVFKKWLQPSYDSSAVAVKSGDKERIEFWNVAHERASENYKAELAIWVKQPFFINSLAAIHHSLRWHPDYDIALMDTMVAVFQKKYPGLELTKELISKVNSTKRTAIGAIAPAFTSKDANGNAIALDSYKEKYTLLDFWASWCGPCRQESPTLVRLYNLYKDKGFTILSVSIDTNKDKWTNAASKDHYTWQNVSELNGYASSTAALYNVSAIPNSFLLDKDGRIIAKNLRGKNLEAKLVELFGNAAK